jgi:hypothetical protein
MHDKKLQNDEGLLECCTTNGFTFTEIAALLTEFSVRCALLLKNSFDPEMANRMKTETSSIMNSTSSKRR